MDTMKTVFRTAVTHPLFAGMSEAAFTEAFSLLCGRVCAYARGETLRAMGMPFPSFGLVLSGTVQVLTLDIDGAPMMMASVARGESFGESLAYFGTKESPVLVLAAESAEVLWLSPEPMRRSAAGNAFALSLSERFTEVLAARALYQNDRIQILSKAKIRDRLCTYLSQCERRAGARSFTIPFDRTSLAVYLGVNRSALSREMGKMQAEGLIRAVGKKIEILR